MKPALLAAALVIAAASAAGAPADHVLVQSTTSTQNSGLYDAILPAFTAQTGIEVRVVAVGSGQAIRNAERCDGDVLVVHARAAEEAFVAAGYGLARHDLMANDFVLIGPGDDPAAAAGLSIAAAFAAIAAEPALFASRGDDSGTHARERAIWTDAGIDAAANSGTWYLETGAGMGATLNFAVARGAYVLADRATWIAFANPRGHRVLVEGGDGLRNEYGIIAVNPARCPNANQAGAAAFVGWMTGPGGRAAIAGFRIRGQQLFAPAPPGGF